MSKKDDERGTEALAALVDDLPAGLKKQMITHSSWVEDRLESFDRLAFLGDSVLNIAISTAIFPSFENYTAGNLTKLRAQAVSRQSCARVARELNVPGLMVEAAPEGEGESVELLVENERILASVAEAIIGACYLIFGFERTSKAVVGAFGKEIDFADENVVDFKSLLQEILARQGNAVVYRVVEQSGPPHDRIFRSVARAGDEVLGEGSGRSKKDSEQEAAKAALEKVKSK